MSAIPPGAVHLPNTATLQVFDPVFGPVQRGVALLSVGEEVLVECCGMLRFLPITALHSASSPCDVARVPAGICGAASPAVDLVLNADQPIGPPFAGAIVQAARQCGLETAVDQAVAWRMVDVASADRIIVDRLAVVTGPLAAAGLSATQTIPMQVYAGRLELAADEVEFSPGQLIFNIAVPPQTSMIRIGSPQRASQGEERLLGVAIQGLDFAQSPIALDSPALARGFHPVEQTDGVCWRWTNGDALIILPPASTTQTLSIRITDWHQHLHR